MDKDEVESVIAEWIRPVLVADGGGVELVGVEGNVIVLKLLALCGGCPGAPYTLEGVIEPMLRSRFGPAVEVRVQRAARHPGE